MGSGGWEAAVEAIAPVAERYEDWAAPNLALGRALIGLRDLEGAKAALSKAIRSNPGWYEVRKELIDVIFELGRPKEAERVIRNGLALWPDSGAGHLLLAQSLLKQGRATKARAAALTARGPDNPAERLLKTIARAERA